MWPWFLTMTLILSYALDFHVWPWPSISRPWPSSITFTVNTVTLTFNYNLRETKRHVCGQTVLQSNKARVHTSVVVAVFHLCIGTQPFPGPHRIRSERLGIGEDIFMHQGDFAGYQQKKTRGRPDYLFILATFSPYDGKMSFLFGLGVETSRQ